jgi:hypothetical protein
MAAAIYLAIKAYYTYSIAAVAVNWVTSAAAAFLWGKKNDEQ